MALQQDPEQRIHMPLNNGKLISFTYLKKQEVNAWTKQILGGVSTAGGADAKVESVAILPAENSLHDEIWLSVKRYVNSVTIRHIEIIQPGLSTDDIIDDAFFVDACITYDGSPATTISGLDHLEGETVNILADGSVIPDQEVSGGDITLSIAASKVHVGLNYISEMLTLYIEAVSEVGDSAQGRLKRLSEVIFRLYIIVGL